jgi:hypothetical protein
VVNPYERYLTFLDDRTRTRRDHLKYLTLIDAIALLHQHQRPRLRSERHGQEKLYIEATLSDIELANELAHEALGRSLDELPPQSRRLLEILGRMVGGLCEQGALERGQVRFSRREVRHFSGWSYDQVRIHLERLVALEYVLVHRGGRGQSFVYELLYDGQGQDGRPFVMGLLDTGRLRKLAAEDTKKTLGGEKASLDPGWSAHSTPIGVGFDPPCGPSSKPMASGPQTDFEAAGGKNAVLEKQGPSSRINVAARRNGSSQGGAP